MKKSLLPLLACVLVISLNSCRKSLTCPEATTLEELANCIIAQMPNKCPDGKACPKAFVVPDDSVKANWRSVIAQMLTGHCEDIVLPLNLKSVYSLSTFNDTDNGQSYCVLMETLDGNADSVVDRGWGTFVFNPNARREVHIQIPHPMFDMGTAEQGIGVFKGIDARTFLMAGTHRHTDTTPSSCQRNYLEADVAHNVANLFQPTLEELINLYGTPGEDLVAIQFHGMGSSSCPGVDVYLTYGVPPGSGMPAPGDTLLELKSNLLSYHPDWKVTVPGDSPTCGLHGNTNVQGRLLNNVPAEDVCITSASAYSEGFVHIEQKSGFRSAGNWTDALEDTFPPIP
jgi:hypothetical protein